MKTNKFNTNICDPQTMKETYDEYVSKLTAAFHNEKMPLDIRMVAGILLINAYLCFRPGELCSLRKDCLRTNGQGLPYIKVDLHFRDEGAEQPVLVSMNTEHCIKEYLDLRRRCSIAEESDRLFILDTREGNTEILKRGFKRLCGRDARLSFFRRYQAFLNVYLSACLDRKFTHKKTKKQ